MPVTAVTFDFWNTIARAHPGMSEARRLAVAAAVESGGAAIEAERLAASLVELGRTQQQAWLAGEHFPPSDGAERLVRELELEGEVGELASEAFLGAGRDAEIELAPAIGATLEHLRDAGVALGIVCDAGFTGGAILRTILEREGLLGLFGGWAFSDEVGAYKPDPRIFGAALGALGAEPAAALHIGDLRRTDVAGARGVGMRTARYRGLADDPLPGAEADFVLDSHAELPELVARL